MRRRKQVFEVMGEALGIALAMLVNTFNFPLYLLSGGVLPAWDLFAPPMIEVTRARSFTFRTTDTRVEKATLGNEAGLYGAAYLPWVERQRRMQCGWESISARAGRARCWWTRAGRIRAGFTAPHEDMRMERPLWAEQRPENWWDAAVQAIRGVLAQAGVSGGEIRGIGLSGQMHGLVILDAADAGDPPVADLVRPAQPAAGGCHQCQTAAARMCCAGPPIRCSPASRCPSCSGCAITSRSISSACARCCCRRTTCASA